MQALLLHMLSNFGLYPGHFKYYIMSLWVLFKSYSKLLLLLFLASNWSGEVQAASPYPPSVCFGSSVSSVLKALAVLFESVPHVPHLWSGCLLSSHLCVTSACNFFGALVRIRSANVQLRAESRSSRTPSRLTFRSSSLSAGSLQFPGAPLF